MYNLIEIAQVNKFLAHHYSIRFDSAWLYLRGPQPLPQQGWKIHISVTIDHFAETVAQIVPVVLRHQCWFKVPITQHALLMLTSGAVDYVETGKIITIYLPHPSVDRLTAMVQALAAVVPCTWHVSVPTDVEYDRTNIYLRYGTYYPHYQIDDHGQRYPCLRNPAGNVERDVYAVGHDRPAWVTPLPIIQHHQHRQSDILGHIPLRQLGITHPQIIRKDAKNTVFAVQYNKSPAILKLSKANQLIDGGTCALDRAASESLIMRKLAGKVRIPQVLLRLESNQRYLLVEQAVTGDSLQTLMGRMRLVDSQREKKMIRVVQSLLQQLTVIHGCGIVYGDLSLGNVFVGAQNQAILIDFDTSSFASDRIPPKGGTPGFFTYGRGSELGRRTVANDTYAFGALLYYMATSFLPLYSEMLDNLGRFYSKMGRIVALTATTSTQYHLGTLGIWIMAHKNTADDEIRRRLTSAERVPNIPRQLTIESCQPARLTDLAQQYIRSRIQQFDYRQKYELLGAGVFPRTTGYVSLNQGIIGLLLVILSYTEQTGDRQFISDLRRILDWIEESYPNPVNEHPGMVNGNILLTQVISHYAAITNDHTDQEYASAISQAAINHEYHDSNMIYSLTDGDIGIAAVFLEGRVDDPNIRRFCRTMAEDCVDLITDTTAWTSFKKAAPDKYGLDRGICGIGIFLTRYVDHFPSAKVDAALAEIVEECRPLLKQNQGKSHVLSLSNWKCLAAFFIVYGRHNRQYADVGALILHAIDRQHQYHFANMRWGVAGLLILAEAVNDQPLIKKYRQLLLASASVRNNTLVWPLPWQVYVTNDSFLDGTAGIYWSLLHSLTVLSTQA
ncbi:protein kinase domain-containing protein [Schleiferilactobacillus shenzhenensis]|uniref:class III lanthionine synthetase LanKC N-terminal domain-containing protein n=1 Tax=Schleiferilactobacillus shenzhenensis TaxID=1231337 RepID=UPI0012DFC039|nr:hypothetical protein [Schleiferilactobacillus shenzhenensis]